MSESKWQQYAITQKLTTILASVTYYRPDHHFGRPFLTTYQLAIAFSERYPDVVQAIGHPLGGAGTGVHFTLTTYLSGQLSQRIRSGEITQIEGAFLSNTHLKQIAFHFNEEEINSSLIASEYDLSMFRYREAVESSHD